MFSPWSFDLASGQLPLISVLVDDYSGKWVVRQRSGRSLTHILAHSCLHTLTHTHFSWHSISIRVEGQKYQLLFCQCYWQVPPELLNTQSFSVMVRKQEVISPYTGHASYPPFRKHLVCMFGKESLAQWLPHGISGSNSCLWSFSTPEDQIRRELRWPDCSSGFLTCEKSLSWRTEDTRLHCRGENGFYFHIIEFL